MARIVIKRPGEPARAIDLGAAPLLIGALAECDVSLNSPFVSRRHAEIRLRRRSYVIVDVGSRNGTYVNDTRLEIHRACALRNGDEVRIDDFRLAFLDQPEARPTLDQSAPRPDQLLLIEETFEVWVGPRKLESLPAAVFKLLAYLYRNRARVCSTEDIGSHVWGSATVDGRSLPQFDANMVHQLVNRLRRRIEPNRARPQYVVNVRGQGYRLFDVPRTEKQT